MMRTVRISIVLVILLALHACRKSPGSSNVQTNKALADSLRLSPSSLEINDDTLLFTAFVWRNFMPMIPKNGSGLYCGMSLGLKDSLPIPGGLKIKAEYVINGNQIWTIPHPPISDDQSNIITTSVSEGPAWGPDILVDLVCEFEMNNRTYRLIARQQNILATY